MLINVHLHVHPDELTIKLLRAILAQGETMKATLDDILAGVQQEKTLDDSIIQLLENLKATVDAAQGDQVKIDAAFAAITDNVARVSKAITDNTPPPTPEPVP